MEFLNSLEPMVKLLIMVVGVVATIAILTVGKKRD